MNSDSILVYKFSSDWNALKDLREKLLIRLKGELEKLAEPIVMTASELVENAIKYGESNFSVSLNVDSKFIDIVVSNTLGTRGDFAKLERSIASIQQCDDPAQLYVARLMELMNLKNPQYGAACIGLIRIANEGKFELSCKIDGNTVEVQARRKK